MFDPIRAAFFGNGFARKVILPCARHVDGIVPVGLSSPNLERARQTAKEFGIEHVASDHREILERAAPDLVFVVTPPHRHEEMTLDALQAGCHVVCEKPTALDALQSHRMLDAAASAPDRLTLLDHELRFHPARRALQNWIASGRLGRILHASYTLRSFGRHDPGQPWSWWSDAAQGGGALGALGSHAIDCLSLFFGEIVAVRGHLQTLIPERTDPDTGRPRTVTSDDSCEAWIRFRSGLTASLAISVVEADRLHQIRVVGTEGSAILDEQSEPRLGAKRCEPIPEPVDWPVPSCEELSLPDTDWARTFLIFLRRIVEALRRGEVRVEGAATFEDGHRTQIVSDTIRRSSAAGDWIKIGP